MLSPNSRAGTLSLVLAVTGHRDLNPADIPLYEIEFARIFKELADTYKHTPLLLLSGLAEGADRIAVRAALASKKPVTYIAVLPMPAHLYRTDFVTQKSREEFDELVHKASRVIEIPLAPDITEAEVRVKGPARRNQYALLGKFLVQYSQILIAIWDRSRPSKPGGTTEVVNRKLRKDVPPGSLTFASMNADGAGPAYIIPARKVGAPPEQILVFTHELEYPDGSDPAMYAASYTLQDQFNQDVEQAGSYFEPAVEKSLKDAFAGADVIGGQESMQWVRAVRARAAAPSRGAIRRSPC